VEMEGAMAAGPGAAAEAVAARPIGAR
jgi:hypothetical protein